MLINVLVLWKAIDYAIKRYICRVTASSILSHFRSFFFFRQSSRYYEGSDFDIFGRLLCCLGSGRSCWPLHPKLRSCWSVSSLGCMPWPTCLHFPAWCVSKKKFVFLRCHHWHKAVNLVYRSKFLPGAYFDLRVETHAYDTSNKASPPAALTSFKTRVRKDGGKWKDIDEFFGIEHSPALERWNFTWIDSIDVAYNDAQGTVVNVASKIWHKLKFDEPGTYDVTVQYSPKDAYTVRYTVVEVSQQQWNIAMDSFAKRYCLAKEA